MVSHTIRLHTDRDPKRLRGNAAHFRRLANILEDKVAAAESLKIAAELEMRALRVEVVEQQKQQRSAKRPAVGVTDRS
jgi:hypothetical protein